MRREENYFDDTAKFGAEEGFVIAAAITGDYKPLFNIPPEIGDLKFYRKSWSQGEWMSFKELEWRFCTRDDFHYNDEYNEEKVMFYETKSSWYDLNMYGTSMRCLKDPEDNDIWGNYNTGNAGAIMIVFEKCRSDTGV